MGRAPCCDKANVKKGPWSPEEDMTLKNYLEQHGTGGNWIALPHKAGLKRCGKSCRLRWLNYLRPDIKHGGFTEEEDNIICSLYNKIGSRWSVIASHLPGRTDNDIKNYWNTRLKKKLWTAEKVPKTDHNNSHNLTSNIPNHLNSAQFPPSLVKTETDNYQMFSPSLDTNATTFPYPIELTTYQQKQADDPIQFPLPELMDVLDFSTSNNNNFMSSSQEISSLSASSSSQAMNLCTAAVPWLDNNGGGMADRFLMDFGFNGSSCDLVNGYVFQEYSEIDPNLSY